MMSAGDIRELVSAAFGAAAHPLAAWYAGMLEDAPPLQSYTAANATKIRKKARHATTPETQRDMRCELAVAAALADRRSPLMYEPLAAKGRRGPDFLLRHKGHTDVYVEVTRLRLARGQDREPTGRLAALLCGKLDQLVAGTANLLVLVSDDGLFSGEHFDATIQELRRRAEANDDAYFAFRWLAGARALRQVLPRLSGMLMVMPAVPTEALCVHQQARHPLPAALARAAPTWGLATRIGPLPDGQPPEVEPRG